jgi:hypothetical protein
MLMDRSFVESVTDPTLLFDEFESEDRIFVIAARVSGLVETAFPDGQPTIAETEEENSSDEEEGDAEVFEPDALDNVDEVSEEVGVEHISASTEPSNILVFADSDILSDRLWVQVTQFFGQRIPQPFANNGDLIINSMDNLSGGADLSSIRSRGRYSRPFTKVLTLQREADDRLRQEEGELLGRVAETEASLAELSTDEDGNPIGELTTEIQTEIDRFNAELIDTRRRLREVRFQLTEDIEQLGSNLKAANTVLVPILLTLFFLVRYYLRSRRSRWLN